MAEALFEEAQKLMTAGKYAEACDKFAASQKLDPAVGTLLNLAACHEKMGKTATAWIEFSDAYGQSNKQGDKQRMQFAKSHMDSLEKALYRVVIEVMKPNKNLSIKLDGQELAREVIGTPFPLDPGAHEIVVTQPSRKTWRRTLNGGSGGTDRIEVPELEELTYGTPHEDTGQGQQDQGQGQQQQQTTEPPKEEPKKGGTNPMLYAGIGALGVGVGAGVVGIIFGLQASDQASQRDKLCKPGTPCRDQKAFDADYNARVDQSIMIAMFIGAGVALAAGGTMLALSMGKKKESAAPTTTTGFTVKPAVGPWMTGGVVEGRF